jgi:D-glycero-beta-D-manno-heptose 1-phosphate adenylyltransferase
MANSTTRFVYSRDRGLPAGHGRNAPTKLAAVDCKIISFESLGNLSRVLKAQDRRIVTTNGCFDLLHLGHIEYLAEAKTLGDVLIVGLNSDASVKRLKGPSRPLNSELIRARQLAGLTSVDYITIFEEATPEEFLRQVHPHVHAKGGDYRVEDLPERHVVEEGGGEVRVLSLVPGYSTTGLIEKLKLLSDEEARS